MKTAINHTRPCSIIYQTPGSNSEVTDNLIHLITHHHCNYEYIPILVLLPLALLFAFSGYNCYQWQQEKLFVLQLSLRTFQLESFWLIQIISSISIFSISEMVQSLEIDRFGWQVLTTQLKPYLKRLFYHNSY